MKTVFIYALKDPDTGQIRYIGKAENPARRLYFHLRHTGKNRKTNWIKNLRLGNISPVLVLVDEVSEEYWPQLECAYIQFYRECGCDLLNVTEGGDCGPMMRGERNPNFGKDFSSETRARMRDAGKRKKFSTAHCANIRAAKLGKKFSPEHCANLSASLTEVCSDPARRAKMRAQKMGALNPNFGKIRPQHARLKQRITTAFNRLLVICQEIK